VCLRLRRRGGGADASDAGRLGNREGGVEVALAGGELGTRVPVQRFARSRIPRQGDVADAGLITVRPFTAAPAHDAWGGWRN
jgi:hypothetical protein